MISGKNCRDQWVDHIRNDDIREILYVGSADEAASNRIMRWFGRGHRMSGVRILNVELPDRTERG